MREERNWRRSRRPSTLPRRISDDAGGENVLSCMRIGVRISHSMSRNRRGGGGRRCATNDLHIVGVEQVTVPNEAGRRGGNENEICKIGFWRISRYRETHARFE